MSKKRQHPVYLEVYNQHGNTVYNKTREHFVYKDGQLEIHEIENPRWVHQGHLGYLPANRAARRREKKLQNQKPVKYENLSKQQKKVYDAKRHQLKLYNEVKKFKKEQEDNLCLEWQPVDGYPFTQKLKVKQEIKDKINGKS